MLIDSCHLLFKCKHLELPDAFASTCEFLFQYETLSWCLVSEVFESIFFFFSLKCFSYLMTCLPSQHSGKLGLIKKVGKLGLIKKTCL